MEQRTCEADARELQVSVHDHGRVAVKIAHGASELCAPSQGFLEGVDYLQASHIRQMNVVWHI